MVPLRCAALCKRSPTRTRAARPGDVRLRLVQHTKELTKHFEHEDTSGKGFIPMTVRLRVVSPEGSEALLGDASAARPRKGSWRHIHNRAPRREARISAVCASRCTQPRPRLTPTQRESPAGPQRSTRYSRCPGQPGVRGRDRSRAFFTCAVEANRSAALRATRVASCSAAQCCLLGFGSGAPAGMGVRCGTTT